MTAPSGPGGAESRIDLGRLDRFVALAAEVRVEAAADVARVRHVEEVVRAGCGRRAVSGTAVDGLADLLRRLEDHEHEVAALGRRVKAADSAGALASGSGPSRWAGVGIVSPVLASVAAAGGGVGAGASAGLNPWLDPDTSSWVVNLLRGTTGPGFTPAFVDRVVGDGPGLLSQLARLGVELSPEHQQELMTLAPGRFARNWGHVGLGLLDAMRGIAEIGVAGAALLTPGGDRSIQQVSGRRPGQELLARLALTARLLVDDPDTMAESQIGWPLLRDDPYRWLGLQAPAALAELLSFGGAEAVAAPSASLARISIRTTETTVDAAMAEAAVEAAMTEAAVDAAMTEAAAGLAGGGAAAPRRLPNLADYRLREPEWADAGPIVSHRVGPFESPESWVADLNGEGTSAPGRRVNCVDTCRAAEANWRGHDAVAAPLAPWLTDGTSASRLEQWSGGSLAPTTIDGIEQRLSELGPGSSAIIIVEWQEGGAHAFNAVNDGGMVKWVDAQLGHTRTWPPPYRAEIARWSSIVFDQGGELA